MAGLGVYETLRTFVRFDRALWCIAQHGRSQLEVLETRESHRSRIDFSRIDFLCISTSFLWWQGVAGTRVVTSSTALRMHWRCTGRHREGLRHGHHTAINSTLRSSRMCRRRQRAWRCWGLCRARHLHALYELGGLCRRDGPACTASATCGSAVASRRRGGRRGRGLRGVPRAVEDNRFGVALTATHDREA
jgi:hypothetical protein